MNDNTARACDDPDWVWDIVDRHDLGLRTDGPLSAVTVLLTDAADILAHTSREVFGDNTFTGQSRERALACATMIADALKLAPLCPGEPVPGTVTEAEDGTLTWADGCAATLDGDEADDGPTEHAARISDHGLLDEAVLDDPDDEEQDGVDDGNDDHGLT